MAIFDQGYDQVRLNRQKFKMAFYESQRVYSDKVDEAENLYTLFSLFVAFSGIAIEDRVLIYDRYEPNKRNLLKMIVRNFKNGYFNYVNW